MYNIKVFLFFPQCDKNIPSVLVFDVFHIFSHGELLNIYAMQKIKEIDTFCFRYAVWRESVSDSDLYFDCVVWNITCIVCFNNDREKNKKIKIKVIQYLQ